MRNKEFRCHPSMIFTDSIKGFLYLVIVVIGGFFEELIGEFSSMLDEGELQFEEVDPYAYEGGISVWFIVLIGALLLGAFLLWRYFVWRRTYITVTDENLLYDKRTYFFKRQVKVDLSKISTVNLKEGIIDRIFGTVTIKLDMSSSATADRTDFRMVFKKDFAKAFERELLAAKNGEASVEPNQPEGAADALQKETPIYYFKPIYVIRHAVLSSSPVLVLALAAALTGFTFPWEKISPYVYFLALVVGIPVTFFIVIVSGAIKTFLRYGDFLISRTENEIKITSGFITKHSYSLPISSSNAVIIRQSFLGRIFKMYYAELINVGVENENENKTPAFCLMVNQADMERLLTLATPEFSASFKTKASPNKAFLPTFSKAVIFALLLTVINLFITVSSTLAEELISYAFIWGITVLTAIAAFKTKGILIGERHLTISNGILSKRIIIVPFSKLQMLTVKSGPLSRALKLKKGTAHIMSGMLNQQNPIGYFPDEVFENIEEKINQHQSVDWR